MTSCALCGAMANDALCPQCERFVTTQTCSGCKLVPTEKEDGQQ